MTPARRGALPIGAAAATLAATAAAVVVSRKRDGLPCGVATAAHLIEGNTIDRDYRVLGYSPAACFREPSGDTCHGFNRWREHLALFRMAEPDTDRCSFEWARTQPEQGRYTSAMLESASFAGGSGLSRSSLSDLSRRRAGSRHAASGRKPIFAAYRQLVTTMPRAHSWA